MFVLAINKSFYKKHNKNKTCIVYLFVYIIYLIWLSSSSIWSPSRECPWSDTLPSIYQWSSRVQKNGSSVRLFPGEAIQEWENDLLMGSPQKCQVLQISNKRQLLIKHSYTIQGHILGDSRISKVLRCQHSQQAQLESSHKPGYKT